MEFKSGSRLVLTVIVAGLLLSPTPARSASQEELLSQLRQFRYGQDPAVLTEVERMVAGVTANPGDERARQQLAQSLAVILETDATDESKQFVCRQLAIIGTARQVPVLAKLLTDDKLSDMARYALAPIPDASVDPALRDALGRTSGKTRIGIINSLGFRRDQAAVGPLGKLLDAPDLATAKASAAALGRIGGAAAAGLLKRALANAKDDSRLAVADAYLACAESFLPQAQREQAWSIYAELFQPGQPAGIRAPALRGLVATGGAAGVGFAMTGLRDADPAVKRAAIGGIQILPGTEVTRQFAAELPKLAPADQIVLLGALADRGDAAALPVATTAATRGDAPVRIAALRALGKLGDASVVDLLVSAAAGQSAGESTAALDSLRTLRGEGADEAVVKRLADAPAGLRAPLVRVLADRMAVTSVPALLRIGADADARVAVEVFKALGQMAAPANLPALLELLARAQSEDTREAAEAAVVAVAHRIGDEPQQADAVLAALQDERREPGRCALLRVLGGIGNARALAALQGALKDGTAAERDAAVRALADWPAPSATGVLLSVFQNTQDPTHRILLLRGLVRLLGAESGRTPAQTLDLCKQVMQQARGTDEVRQALSLLATVSDPQALELVEPHLKEAAVREEAAMAAVKIVAPLAGRHPDLARATIQRVLAVSQNSTVKQQANAVLQALEKNEDFITAWQVAGPFTQAGKSGRELFDIPFPPESAGDRSTKWRQVNLDLAQGQAAILDLMALLGGSQRVAYLRTWVHSGQTQKARLEVGSDDGVKAWLNGAVVHANNADRGLAVGEDKVPVTLNEGWNLLLLKITQGEGGWAACARVRDPDGNKLGGIRFDAAHEEASPPAR